MRLTLQKERVLMLRKVAAERVGLGCLNADEGRCWTCRAWVAAAVEERIELDDSSKDNVRRIGLEISEKKILSASSVETWRE